MKENHGAVTFQGNPLTLLGNRVTEGEKAPAFSLSGNDMSPITLADYSGKVLVLVTVPSLDTPVCDLEVRRFNQEAGSLGENIEILVASMDLPFAQARWCGAAGIDRVRTASGHLSSSFGEDYGLLIKELRLLARSVMIIDGNGILRYSQLVTEVAQEPDYESVLKALKSL
ncbi:MAG: thiol peroxidase [Candidatus Wallbacteria bacterium HGW-Wallbacteria-1]|jgi:thiol peroxidase|uniref:Thiol peroxidase n=1 Tax=Candidatus Wallbacteria bacterium HGW-Wallbacteria-1 TaxID=2013854 RepID=A0A2N1PSB3_9BACT|nr:MAG: thiol peroxidase [Candidatus Wallbacteria bacterium HGW-Wallbacteria-1]